MTKTDRAESDTGTEHSDLARACVMVTFGVGWSGLSVLVYQQFTTGNVRPGVQVGAELLSVVMMLFGAVMVLFGLFLLFGTVAKATIDRIGVIR